MSKTIVITGGCGFIGANLCRRLLNDGHLIVCIDNLYCSSLDNIRELRDNRNFIFLEMDVTKKDILDISLPGIDEIYHLACPASPPIYQKDPIFTLNTNYIGTRNLLELAVKYNSKILLSSTSEIYGDPSIDEQHEEYWGNVNSYGPRSCYDEGKRIAETLFREYKMKFNLDAKVVRIFNTYGPYMNKDDGRVVSNFINQALESKMITIYGDGKQTRSLCYIDDLIEGLTLMMNSKLYKPINLGNPNEMTINELALEIIELTKSKSKIIYLDLPKDDPKKRKPVIKRAKENLNWNPKVSLKDGLIKTIKYYKSV